MPRSYALEEYLEAIYILESEGMNVIGARLADFLKVRAPSVTEALKRLEKRGLITVDLHHAIALTPVGKQEAEDLVRRHRVAERWLTDVIGLDWAQADVEATKLAHAFSADVTNRLSHLMDDPKTCPHGNPIPGNWEFPTYAGQRLDTAPLGETMVVERVVEAAEVDLKLLRYLWGQGILPGAQLTVVEQVLGAGTITVMRNGEEVALGMAAASKIHVHPLI